jgi:transcriptional regulator with XRE-family HTH domain
MSYHSQFLEDAYLGDLTTLHQLQFRCRHTNEQAAKALSVSPHTYRRWLLDRKPNPTALRLYAILAGYVPWRGWEDWEMHNGYLFPPGFVKNGISPGDWQATVFLNQLVTEYRRKIDLLESQVQVLQREKPAAPVLSLLTR